MIQAGWFDDPMVRAGFDSLINVFAISFAILLFLFYWEAHAEEEEAAALEPFQPAYHEDSPSR